MAQPQEFPFNIMDVAELLHLHIRRRQADSVYADCPICGDKRGKMNINFAKNLWRCNYCNEGGGMLALYGKVYGISNSEAYREICDTLQNGLIRMLLEIRPFVVADRGEQISGKLVLCRTGFILTIPHNNRPPIHDDFTEKSS